MADTRGILKSTTFDEAYYTEHIETGLDFLAYGEWHEAYARMVTDACLQRTYDTPFVVDVGCACGAILQGFRSLGVYGRIFGCDMVGSMIAMGREKFNIPASDMQQGSAANMPIEKNAVTLIHSMQTLEHIPHHHIGAVIRECYRVLRPGGRMFHNWAGLKYGNPPDIHDGDPTHINVKPMSYWADQFAAGGFVPDFECYDRFVSSKEGPGEPYGSFFETYGSQWSTGIWRKPEASTKKWFF